MMERFDFGLWLILISCLTIAIMEVMILRTKNKSQLKYVFIYIFGLLIIWDIGTLLELCYRRIYGHTEMIFINICYFAICFLPIGILMLGIIYARTHIKFKKKYLLLIIIPVISTILVWTNRYHHLFFVSYSVNSKDAIYGIYFYLHSLFSYVSIFIGIFYLVVFSIKGSGLFSKQSIFIILGLLGPVLVNIIFTFNIADLPFMSNAIAFTCFGLFIMIAIFKFDFLNVIPIAMQTVVDRISDSFVVINENYRIVDYNRTIVETFGVYAKITRKKYLFDVLDFIRIGEQEFFKVTIEEVKKSKKAISFEYHFKQAIINKYFTIEITPIISNANYLGTIILLKDITEHIKNLKTIQQQQDQIIGQERLASLGALIGGISHNLKTPIMSISGCIMGLEDLIKEYDESIGNPIVNSNDHHEMAFEMSNHLHDLKGHVAYMSNALTAIKNQVVNPESQKNNSFSLSEVVVNVEFLMKYELKTNCCTLEIRNEVKNNYFINGDVGTLVQIINNLISNSIQSYEKISEIGNIPVSPRKIEFIISEENKNIIFCIRDYGKGVPEKIKDVLFNEMVTTKGKDGSGIGLYLSYSKIKVMFYGDMWFESQEGKGTSFYIKIIHT